MMRLLTWAEYHLFYADATDYHLVQILLHVANSLLVLGTVGYYSKRWRIAFVAAILFASFPVASEAVFWISEHSPSATFFSLVAILCWMYYLRTKTGWSYPLAVFTLALALLSKESAIVLPVVFFLIDFLLFRKEMRVLQIARRYLLIGVVSATYLAIEYMIQSDGLYVEAGGYSFGPHVISNYAAYIMALFVSQEAQFSIHYSLMVFALGVGFIGLASSRQRVLVVFLVGMVFLTIGPVVLAPLGIGTRYLYFATVPFAILWAIGFETIWTRRKSTWLKVIGCMIATALVISSGVSIANAAAQFSESLRQARVPYRDIMRQNPSFPNDTRVFLIEPPGNPPMTEVAGMFFLNYGSNLSVGGTFQDGRPYTYGQLRPEPARLRNYAHSYVYYFDETNRPLQVPVDKDAITQVVPEVPAAFQAPIRLEGYEITRSTLKRNEPLVLILYWRATGKIDGDYTVFVHLADATGKKVTGEDSAPRSGKEKTSLWWLNQFTADAHVLSIPQDLAGGTYHLEVGLYNLATMQRLSILDSRGIPLSDQIVIKPLHITD